MKLKTIILLFLLLLPFGIVAIIRIPDVIIKPTDNSKNLQTTLPLQTISKELKTKLQPQNVTELLQKTTSLLIQSLDGIKATVSMRGFGDNAAQNILIMLNGQPLSQPDLGITDIDLLPIASIKQIEVASQSFGVLYGDQAVGGIVNIITKSPQKNFGAVDLSYGSFNTYDLQGEIANSFKNGFGYDVNFGSFISDHYRDHNKEHKNHAAINITYHKNNTDAYVEYLGIDQRLQLAGALTAEQLEQDRKQSQNNTDQSNIFDNIILAGLKQKLNQNWQFKIDSSFMYAKGNGTVTASNIPYDYTNKRYNYFLRPELLGQVNFFNWLLKPILGLEFKNADYKYNSTAYGSNDSQLQLAAFGQINLQVTPKFTVITGIRTATSTDKINYGSGAQQNTNTVLPFTLGIKYKLAKHWLWYIRRDDNYRFPKVDENTVTLNNQPLKTQTGVAYETGIDWHTKKTLLQLQLFQLNLHNEIAYIPLINTPRGFGYNENLDNTRRRGININLTQQLMPKWDLIVSYSYVNAHFTQDNYHNNYIPNVPNHVFNITTDYTYKQHWQPFINLHYLSSYYPNNDVANLHRVPGYTLANAGLSYIYKKIRITAQLNNITNKKYNSATVMSYDATGTPELLFYPATGINGSIGLVAQL